jgi:DNA-binding MarR family transcriptional regulator
VSNQGTSSEQEPGEPTQPDPARLGLGGALRQAAAGFGDRGFPDGRVLHICLRPGDTTISQIGRELGITRQGASKLVTSLAERDYVTLATSTRDRREKIITLTPRATDYLAAQRKASTSIEHELRAHIGAEAFDSLHRLLTALRGAEQP